MQSNSSHQGLCTESLGEQIPDTLPPACRQVEPFSTVDGHRRSKCWSSTAHVAVDVSRVTGEEVSPCGHRIGLAPTVGHQRTGHLSAELTDCGSASLLEGVELSLQFSQRISRRRLGLVLHAICREHTAGVVVGLGLAIGPVRSGQFRHGLSVTGYCSGVDHIESLTTSPAPPVVPVTPLGAVAAVPDALPALRARVHTPVSAR